jgi:hypothetical protein
LSKNIYKYVGPSYIDKVIGSHNQVTLKCSYPKDFNDPYELFLTIDFTERPEVLAYYSDLVGALQQYPITCFSSFPSIIPMWAHYAQNLEGFVIEFDEGMLAQSFPKSEFGDIDYRDVPDENLKELLYRALTTLKFRHAYMLQNSVYSNAYFTKAKCWSYEQERRMIVDQSELRTVGDLMLMDVPKNCVKALLCGPRALPETVSAIRDKALQLDCNYYTMKIGKNSAVPFFIDSNGEPFTFNGESIESSTWCCSSCKEPIVAESEKCSWCQINDSLKIEAAEHNSLRILRRFGLLDKYINSMDDITRAARKRDT